MELSKEKILKIRERLPQGSNKIIAARLKVCQSLVSNVLRGKMRSSPTTLSIISEALKIIVDLRDKEKSFDEIMEIIL